MSEKHYTRAWRLGLEKEFLSIYGVKNGYASDLLFMGDIEINKELQLKYNIKSKKDILKLNDKTCAKILEEMGWKWVKI